jgi:hypothetical protein
MDQGKQDAGSAGVTRGNEPDEEYVTVKEVTDLTLLPVLESILEGAEIPFRARGEGLVNLFPTGALAAGASLGHATVRIQVPREHEEAARALLEAVETPSEEEGEVS